MVRTRGAEIQEVIPKSIAAQLELVPGDTILAVNGRRLADFIDFLTLTSEETLILEVRKRDGQIIEIEFQKDPGEPLGLTFNSLIYDGLKECDNKCLFCFVRQLPAGQRSTLYIRDDDYRLSFLQGCYITLTNLAEADWSRIENFQLSPLYISVHATDPAVRGKLLGVKKAGAIMEQLRRLAASGITMHTQAVICPGINDGPVLERTIVDLAGLWPAVASLAVVPVGLTKHRTRLYKLRKFEKAEARAVINLISGLQNKFLKTIGARFVFAADEWYIQAGEPFPAEAAYEDYPQLDNGVGLSRWFISEFEETLAEYLPLLRGVKQEAVIITGLSAARMWRTLIVLLNKECPGLKLSILPVVNHFFGETVTVAGLLGGMDLAAQIGAHPGGPETVYLIPRIALRQGEDVFLDGMSLKELKRRCQPKRIETAPTKAGDWLRWFLKKGSVGSCRER